MIRWCYSSSSWFSVEDAHGGPHANTGFASNSFVIALLQRPQSPWPSLRFRWPDLSSVQVLQYVDDVSSEITEEETTNTPALVSKRMNDFQPRPHSGVVCPVNVRDLD